MCKNNCRLCDRFIISTSVTFTGGNLVIGLPAGNYANGCKYCIVVAQSVPATTTITAPVFVTIGTDTTLYPLNRCDCVQLTACAIRARTRYAVKVVTDSTGGAFKLLGKQGFCCAPAPLASLPVAAATAADGGGGGA